MANFAISGTAILRTTLLATTALALSAGLAAARVGVTSATDGDPLGKPPSDAERVLRIGIDVQANELITTRANDRAHLVFLDGTSLTVGPNAQLTIDKFVYDPNTKTGELAVSASKGVLRLVGGKISKTQPITITTPSSTIGIRGGITILTVEPSKTTSTFVFGKGMTVSAAGQTQTVTRQGTQVTTSAGTPPGQPTVVPAGGYTSQLSQLEGGGGQNSSSGSSSGGSGGGGQQAAGGGATGGATATGTTGSSSSGGGAADQKAAASGFSSQNSSQAPAAVQPPTVSLTAGSPAQNVANANIVSNALTNAATDQQQQRAVQQAQLQNQTTTQTTQTAQITPTPTATPTPTPTPTPEPVTQVIVTRGRFSQSPAYTNFNPQTLAATSIPANNQALTPTGTLTNGIATISLADGRFFSVPWQPGGGAYAIALTHPTLGPLNGTGYVTPTGDFFIFSFTDSSNQKVGFAGGTPTTLAQFPTSGFGAHNLTVPGSPGNLPFANPTVAGDPALKAAATVGPLFSRYSPDSNPVVGGPLPSGSGSGSVQSTVAITGVGAAQKSYIGTFIGDYFKDFNVDSTFNSGSYNGTYRLSSTDMAGRNNGSHSTFDVGGAHSVFGPTADTMVYSQTSYSSSTTNNGSTITGGTTTSTYTASLDSPGTGSATDYRVNTLATRTTNPAALSGPSTTQTLTGFVGGLVEQTTSTGGTSVRAVGASTVPSFTLQTDGTRGRVAATINITNWDGIATSAQFHQGDITGRRSATQTFINDQIYGLRDRPNGTFTSQLASVTTGAGTSTGADVTARTNLTSYGAAPVANFFAEQGVTPCTCEFMTWGWWNGEVRYGANSVYNPNGRDRLHLGTYVAGNITQTLQMPLTGTATYTGHVVANIQNGPNAYVAAGTYQNTWSFGSSNNGTGVVTISNLDGVTFNGSSFQVNNGNNAGFTGSIFHSPSARNITVQGAFYSSPTVAAKGQGGNVNITGPSYKGSGTFAAQRP
jgi:hypothetical protein